MEEEHEEEQRPLGCFDFLRALVRRVKKKFKRRKKRKAKKDPEEKQAVKTGEQCHDEKKDEQEDLQVVKEGDKEGEDDEQFLQSRVAFLTREELHNLGDGCPLGEGGYGSVRKLTYEGTEAVVKTLLDESESDELLKEARVLAELDGQGGVPRLLAVCQAPPALVQEFLGHTYDTYLARCDVRHFLRSLDGICHQLRQVHATGFVHNDLKMNNITFTGDVSDPQFHIIDFGVACRVGEELVAEPLDLRERMAREKERKAKEAIRGDTIANFLASLAKGRKKRRCNNTQVCDNEDSDEEAAWMAPEVLAGERVMPSGDVYSLGYLLDCLQRNCLVEGTLRNFLSAPLRRLSHLCTQWDPRRRPSLAQVSQAVQALADHLSARQLAESLIQEE